MAVIVRTYDPAIVGQYQLIQTWLFFATALSCFGGIKLISVRELSQSGDKDSTSIFSGALMLQFLFAAVVCLITVGFANSLSYFSDIAEPLTIGAIVILAGILLPLSQSLLISKELISKVVVSSIVGSIVATFLIVIAANFKASLSTLIIAWAGYQIVFGIMVAVQSRAWKSLSFSSIKIDLLKRFSLQVLPVLVMSLAAQLYVRIDVIMLDYFTSKETIAQYGAGYLFLDQLMILSNFMMSALFPNFAKSTLEKGRDFQVLYRGILVVFLKYLVPLALCISIFAKPLLNMFYGEVYASAWPSLSILMFAAIFAWINGPAGTIFISLKKQHIYMWATIISLGVNVIGNLILIPVVGAVGAAISTVLTELAICTFCLYWIYRETGYLPWMKPVK